MKFRKLKFNVYRKFLLKMAILLNLQRRPDFTQLACFPKFRDTLPRMGSLTGCAPLKAVLFDIDGTLFNSDKLHFTVFQDVLAEYGYGEGRRISESFFVDKISGRSNLAICADLFPQWTSTEAESFIAYKEKRFRDLASEGLAALATPGLDRLLDWIEEHGLQKAAVTNAPRANAELMLSAIGRLDWFDTLVIGDECSAAKPYPDPYLEAMRRLGVRPESCLALEDSPSGATAAVAAGVRTIGILSTQEAGVLSAVGCSTLIVDFHDQNLWQVLSEMRSHDTEVELSASP